MKNSLYNKRHLKEYLTYGFLASLAYTIPVLVFFFYRDYNQLEIVYLGSIFFMFVIMAYVMRLSKRRPEYKSSWMMIIAAHIAVLVGIVFSVLFTILLCFIYIPGFLSGNSTGILKDVPRAFAEKNSSLLMLLFICATIENFGVGGFIAILGPYVFKKNQTKDKSAVLENHIIPKHV
jgi:amino acid transporter